ncbi:MAG: fimbrial biogenesis outer membrane usher protein [Verrucomicrobia bacterium]|nr:fimbrial biogenesis outer membrane usher protein [Verrucomicrobiota bacterium]
MTVSFLLLAFAVMVRPASSSAQVSNAASAPSERTLVVPLFIEKQECGEVRVWLATAGPDVQAEAAPVLKELAARTTPESLAAVNAHVDARGRLSTQSLKAAGFGAEFNERTLELHLAVPPTKRRPTEIQIYGRREPPGAAEAIRPSDLSAYLNLRSGLDYVHQSQTGAGEGLQPVRLDLESAVNLRHWVLEANAGYVEDARTTFQRREVRVVRDDPAHRLRYSAGDLAYPVTSFQSYQPLGGFSVARNFLLQPYRVTEPLGRASVYLKSDSKVEVFVNGRQVQSLQLRAGQHTLRDFLFASGANDVVLRITDSVGRVEVVPLSFFFDTRLLAQGEQEFAYNIGALARVGDGRYDYEKRCPGYSMFHRLGVTDKLTLGASLQGSGVQQMLGGEAVLATRLGTFSTEVGGSRYAGTGFDTAARMEYRYYNAGPDNRYSSIYSFATQYRGRSFVALGERPGRAADLVEFIARYSQRLPWDMTAGLGGTYQLNLGSARDGNGVNLFFSKRIGSHLTAEVTLDRNETVAGQTEYRAFFSLNVLLPGPRQSINSSHDTLTGLSRVDWQYTPRRNVGGLAANAGAQRSPHDYQFFGGGTYTGYRGEFSLTEDITTPSLPGMATDVRTRLRAGSALVFADGQFAVSRPVLDSFAIVAPHPSLHGQKIGTEPIASTYSARSDFLGPAVIPDLQSYQVRRVIVEAPDLPVGYDFGPDIHTLRPSYKSGSVIRVGTDANVSLTGTLLDAAGQTVPLQAGELVDTGDKPRPAVTLFTNREGRFYVEGLRPGRYELRLFADPAAVVAVEIPKGKTGAMDAGALSLPAGAKLQ